MYCTDRAAQTCGDTDEFGNLVDKDGNPVAPMTGLPVNPKLSIEQEKVIAYLVQVGHTYAGVGNQAWGGVTEARSDRGTNERAALQTLVWCVSDPATTATDFATTCDNNMDAAEQAHILSMIPDVPEIVISLTASQSTLKINESAKFTLKTNVFNQPIQVETGGTSSADWSICSGDATLNGSVLTVTGTNPAVSKTVVICAKASTAGTATLRTSAAPASTEHIGWSQSVNPGLAQACQVYATFHEVHKVNVNANAQVSFAKQTVTKPSKKPTAKPSKKPRVKATPSKSAKPTPSEEELAESGPSGDLIPLWLGIMLLGVGGTATLISSRHARKQV